ncbi:hypothetical protein MBLNU230_g1147t1 [Neophaeotheca triangularis]
MYAYNCLSRTWKPVHVTTIQKPLPWCRRLHHDGRNRLSNFWTPTKGRKPSQDAIPEDGHQLLLRAGFLRQAHSGLFHLLPLGLRVQNKLEALIDHHMQSLGASKVSLSSLSSEELWRRSGRLQGRDAEFLRLADRKGAKYLLAPTHEEEITSIVAEAVNSYKDLPLRLYQISRKYRDEARPRQGLLRGREFVMKDLYTFDITEEQAKATYESVRQAYRAFFDDLALPYLVAAADSGNMGGSLSHEYHFATDKGEDSIIGCSSCDLSTNEELYTHEAAPEHGGSDGILYWHGVTRDRRCRVVAAFPNYSTLTDGSVIENDVGIHALKAVAPRVDTSNGKISSEGPDPKMIAEGNALFVDARIAKFFNTTDPGKDLEWTVAAIDGQAIQLTEPRAGEKCPHCTDGILNIHQAVEIGHTFHLGTRYSKPLGVEVLDSNNKQVTVQMGCHGVGVSRLLGAVATLLADSKGLNWPTALAPFNVMIIPGPKASIDDASELYDSLLPHDLDVVIDDRDKAMGWKLNDADLVGYPFIVVMGKSWASKKIVEVQCRQLNAKMEVSLSQIGPNLEGLKYRLRNQQTNKDD